MKRWLLLTVVLLLFASPAFAQTSGICPGITKTMRAYAHETLSVTTVVKTFTSATYAPAGSAPQMAVMSVETATIRMWNDGTAPSTTVGQLLSVPAIYIICGQTNVQNTKMIATSGTAIVSVVYYQ